MKGGGGCQSVRGAGVIKERGGWKEGGVGAGRRVQVRDLRDGVEEEVREDGG
ncbi:MAG: hypothetical protein BWZ08_02629 [candidate division BRC1 bacterium ADurb.BinA292]|nr:MAG: hypothetical protein BWZ08_02629 [candidate division BRC1 bacterium ADurb.BinA292]